MNTERNDQDVMDVGKVPDAQPPAETSVLLPQEPVTPKSRGRKKAEIDESLFDEAIEFIKEKINETVFRGSVEIGEYIFKKFYNGDPDLVSSRNPQKESSLRRLAERPDCPLTYASISNMVRVAVQEQFFIERKIDTSNLHYTHKIKLLAIENGDAKISIAENIIQNSLSTRDASHLIGEQRSKEHSKVDEKHRQVSKTVRDMRYFLGDTRFSRFDFQEKSIVHLDGEQRKELKGKITGAIEELKKLNKEYKNALTLIEDVEKGVSPVNETGSK